MMEKEMKVGPKGQVVIPRSMRKALKIHPGSRIIFRLEGDRAYLRKQEIDTATILELIAKKGPSVSEISPHLYEEELERRTASSALS
ncbi:AbrB/MazE/SpoVT family DNA-binding domain-containing protein [Candidatus Bathyarchaeota archaeon]|nr:AbrB/MazE/SpoVT family DNA-binding domain-containing protein [Candidatus Bathyarchaeota archaeon]